MLRLHAQDVIGCAHVSCKKMLILGKISESQSFIAAAGDVGLSLGGIGM